MNAGRLLEGEVLATPDPEIEALRAENRQLRRQVADAEVEAQRAREDASRALTMLRRQLGPLYRALQAVFGELDAAGIDDGPAPTPQSPSGEVPAGDPRITAVWESWKQKLGPLSAPARVIDALLVHGSMNVAQLKVAAKMANQTVYDSTSKLYKLGLLDKSGGRYSLKRL